MSDDENNSAAGNSEDVDAQMAFVLLLEDCKVLLDKRQTPAIKAEKDAAAAALAETYGKNTNQILSVKQVMKKLNNMKSKVKEATDLKKTGNKEIILTEWQKKLYSLWNDSEAQGDNPVLNEVPGAATSGLASTSKLATLTSSPFVKKRKSEISQIRESGEFEGCSLQQLQRMCLIQQIRTARAQENAANEMKVYYKWKNNERNSLVLFPQNLDPTLENFDN